MVAFLEHKDIDCLVDLVPIEIFQYLIKIFNIYQNAT